MLHSHELLDKEIYELKQAANSAVKRLDIDLHDIVYVRFEQPLSFNRPTLDEEEDPYIRDNYKNLVSILGSKASPIYNWRGQIQGSIKERSPRDLFVLPHHHAKLQPFISRDFSVINDIATIETSSAILSKNQKVPIPGQTWHITRHTPLGPELCEKTSFDSNTGQGLIHTGRLGDTVPFTSSSDIRHIPLDDLPPEIAETRIATLCRALAAATEMLDNASLNEHDVSHTIRAYPHREALGHILQN